jgi:hypothetical protein
MSNELSDKQVKYGAAAMLITLACYTIASISVSLASRNFWWGAATFWGLIGISTFVFLVLFALEEGKADEKPT